MTPDPKSSNVAAGILRRGDAARVALRFRSDAEQVDVTYGELRERVARTAAALGRLGVQEEQRVLVVLPDGPECVYAFLGAIWAGAVPVLVSTFLAPPDYLPFLRETRARAVVTTEAVGAALGADLRAALLAVGPGRSGSLWRAIEECPPSPEPFSTHPDDPAFWLYSSGTTGAPKAVIHRHRDIVHAVAAYGRHVLDLRPDDRAYATSKLFFAYGLGASLYFPLAAGASAVLSPEPFSAARTWTVLAEERPTLFFAVPSVYRALLEQAPRHAAQAVAGLRRVVSAGEALPPALFHAWQARFGQEILDGLGSTEALHIFLSNRPGACTPGSPGRPVPGYDVRVVDEGDVPVAAGTPGGLLVRGDSIAAGYWQRAEATRRTFRGEWLATGDQVVENADGSFQLLGRTDDMLKVSGQWVSPPEVEGVVATVHGVRECAVIGAADNDGVTEVVACIVCTADDHDDLRARVEHACGALPRFKRPKRIVLLESLPRTATGKIQRSALRVRLGGTR